MLFIATTVGFVYLSWRYTACSCLYTVLCTLQIVYPKSDEQRQRLSDAIKHILLFRNLDPVSIFFLLHVCNVSYTATRTQQGFFCLSYTNC